MSLTLSNISKTYPNGIQALSGINLELQPGEVFGLVGPNGAGKSTLLKVISGLLNAATGSVSYAGNDITSQPAMAARYIGLMPDPLGVYTDITTWEYLEFFGRILGLSEKERAQRIHEVVEELELTTWLHEEVETLSSGWQRRVALGRILLAKTPVLLLDEPAAGLDISARCELLEIVRRLASQDRSIIISSHILPELQDLADRFGILAQGQWKEVAPGQTFFKRADIEQDLASSFTQISCSQAKSACALLDESFQATPLSENSLRILMPQGRDSVAEAVQTLCTNGHAIYSVNRSKRDLSDIVLSVLDTPNSGDQS